jgi:low affinity Fe/Cu permease
MVIYLQKIKGNSSRPIIIGIVLSLAFVVTQSYAVVVGIYIFYGIVLLWAFFGALFRGSDWYRMY